MKEYNDLLWKILGSGVPKKDRLCIFGHQMRFDLQGGFPFAATGGVILKEVALWVISFMEKRYADMVLLEGHLSRGYSPRYAAEKGSFQLFIGDGKISCLLEQQQSDVVRDVPFSLACYALLTHILADKYGLRPGEVIWNCGEVNLYLAQKSQAESYLAQPLLPLPKLAIHRASSCYKPDNFQLKFQLKGQ